MAITIGRPAPGNAMFSRSAATGAATTGRNEATDSSVLRMPKIRPRTSGGSSSCSAVCDGIATNAYSTPAVIETATTSATSERTGARTSGSAPWIGPTAGWRSSVSGFTIASRMSVTPMATRPISTSSRFGIRPPYALRNRMPITAPSPAGPTTKKKSWDESPSTSRAKVGPTAPITPISDAAMPRYVRDQAIRGVERTKAIPSRIWPTRSRTARSAALSRRAAGSGGTLGRGTIAAAARPNITATVT